MIRTIRRPAGLLTRPFAVVVAVLTALVLASCGTGPSRVNAAATVGDRVVPLDDVQAEIRWLLDNVPQAEQAQQQHKIDQVSREAVRSRVVHELLDVAARRDGLKADPTQVDRLIEAMGGLDSAAKSAGIEPSRVRTVAEDQVLLEELGKHYQHRLSVSFVGAMVTESTAEATDSQAARDLGRQLAADPENAEDLLRNSGHQVVDQTVSLADALGQDPELAISAVFGAAEGTVVVIQPSRQQTGWLVALVTDRTVAPTAADAQDEQPVQSELLYWVGLRQLQPIADELGVDVNPRYGVWDDTDVSLAPSDAEVTGYQYESRTVQP